MSEAACLICINLDSVQARWTWKGIYQKHEWRSYNAFNKVKWKFELLKFASYANFSQNYST